MRKSIIIEKTLAVLALAAIGGCCAFVFAGCTSTTAEWGGESVVYGLDGAPLVDKDGNVLPKEKETTGIGSTNLKDMQTTTSKQNIYNINGQFVGTNLATLPKGIYIQNGRKVIK